MKRIAPTLVALALLAACSTDPTVPSDLASGTVIAVGAADALAVIGDARCRPASAEAGDRTFVAIRYFSGRHAHVRIAALRDGFHPAVGDRALFPRTGCGEAFAG